jgi:hypothetical protein
MDGVYPYLDCSTGHLTHATMVALESETIEGIITVASYEEGCFITVPFEAEDEDFPEDLLAVLTFARERECLVIRFDADGDIHDDLPFHEW